MRPEHLSLFRHPGRPAPHPDGTWAVVAISRPDLDDDAYPSSLWRLDLADGGLVRLTHSARDCEPVISPDGRHLAFVRAVKGGKPQIAIVPTSGGEPRILTDHPLGVGRPVFSPDSRRIAYTARVPEQGRYGTDPDVGPGAEPPRHITDYTYRGDGVGFKLDKPHQVFVLEIPTPLDPLADPPQAAEEEAQEAGDDAPRALGASPEIEPRQITTENFSHFGPVWLSDAELLLRRDLRDRLGAALLRHAAVAGSQGTVIDVGSEGVEGVVADPDTDGGVWLLRSDLGEDGFDFIGASAALVHARLTDSGLTDVRTLTDATTDRLLSSVFTVAGGAVVVAREHRGSVQLVRYTPDATPGTEPQVLLGEPDQSVYAAEPVGTGGSVLAAVDDLGSVGDLHLIAPDGAGTKLTDLSARLRAEAGVIEPVELEATAPDGYPVHGWVALPPGEGPHPAILLIHGGPHSQYQQAFFDEVQVYAEAGYGVVYCNPRGSSGYGRDHGRAIIEGFGDRDAVDVLAFLEAALAANPSLDGDRVGVMGGSYGGYMTAWLTTQDQRWQGAIVERGFLDPVSFVGSSDIGWFFGLRYLGEDPEKVAAQSPMAHLDAVATPTLVIHSEEDWRCPVEQGQRWFVELKRRGVPTEFLLFPGEGHELSRSGRPKHRLARFEHILRWWEAHLPVSR